MGRNAILAVVAQLVARDLRNNTGGNLAELQARTGLDLWTMSWGRLRAALESTDIRVEVAAHGQASGSLQCRLD